MHAPKFRPVFLLFLISLILNSGTVRSQFQEIYKGSDFNNHITGISFINSSTGYVSFSKFIGYTQDGGKTFSPRYISYANVNFNGYFVGLTFGFIPQGVVAFSTDSLLVYGSFSFEPSILFSSNGGLSWKLVFHHPLNLNAPVFSDGVTDIEFPGNAETGYALHHEQILKTTNRGQTWVPVYSAPSHLLRKLSCPSPNKLYASGGNKVYTSSNGGTTWVNSAPLASSGNPHFNNIFFVSENTGYCTENTSSQIYKTVNGGQVWTKMNDETIIPVRGDDLWITNDSTGFLATGLYEVMKTTDHGKTWEVCKKDKPYQYKAYDLNSLFFLNNKLGWAGGDGEYLISTTDGGSVTIPSAYFKIDMTNVSSTNVVNLVNYSKNGYSYKWFKNGVLISSDYNTSYTHSPSVLKDAIALIVSNGSDSDTMIRYADFSAPMTITSFTPEVGYENREIIIRGKDFFNITGVSFGGIPARYFLQRSGTEIYALVGNGASGEVRITNPTTSASKGGFVFLTEPKTNLQVTVEDSILCKAEPVTISVSNSEPDVIYELKNESDISFGGAKGNGGELRFASIPLNTTGIYYVWASRNYLTSSLKRKLPQPIQLRIEHTRSVYYADKINIEPGESVNFNNYSLEATTFAWNFPVDANVSTSNAPSPSNIKFSSAGQKTITLISISDNGCRDTLTKDIITVYNKPPTEDLCYANNTEDDDSYEIQGTLSDMTSYTDDGYLVSGYGTNPLIKSRYGTGKKIISPAVGHLAKYTKEGILKWVNYLVGGHINSAVADKNGNIYLTGYCHSDTYFHFNNGDSITFVPENDTNHPGYDKDNGFVMKIDARGKYVWHTLIFDPSKLWQGYPLQGGLTVRTRLQGNRLVITGSCLANLSYFRNGTTTSMVSVKNSTHPGDNQNNFILNIDTSGRYIWSSYIHNGSTNELRALTDIGMDTMGHTYITGIYEESATIFDALNKNVVLFGANAAAFSYILKYDDKGNLLWNIHTSNREVSLNACTIDPSGFLYVTGKGICANSSQYFILNNANGTDLQASYGGYFIAKIHPDGRALWTQGCQYAYYGSGSTIYHDGVNVFTAGTAYNNSVHFSHFNFTSGNGNTRAVPIYESEFFLAKYDSDGVLLDIKTSGENTGGYVTPIRLLTDSKKNLLLGGYIDNWNGGNGQFNIFGNTLRTNNQDAFYAKLNPTSCGTVTIAYPNAGNDTVVCAGQPVVLGVANPGGHNYSWSSNPVGFSSTTAIITVTPDRTTTYYVSLLNISGTITYDTVVVTISSPIADAGPDRTICSGSNVTIGISGMTNIYSWSSEPIGFTSQLANPIVNTRLNTRYFLEVQDSIGCKAFDTVSVSVLAIPDKPVILEGLDNYLESSSPEGNQWYMDTTHMISNAIVKRFRPELKGWYSVRVTQNGCISEFSDKYNLNAIVADERDNLVVISPNPAHQDIKIDFIIPGVRQLQVELFDVKGTQILIRRNVNSGYILPIIKLSQGIYILKLSDSRGKVHTTRKLFKF